MEVQLKPWGNSQGIRLSKEFLSSAGIKPDEALLAQALDGQIVLSKKVRHRSLRERAEAYRGELRLSEELDWDAPQGSEVW